VEKVELFFVAFLPDAFEHHDVQRIGIAHRDIKPQGLRPCRIKLR